MSEPDSPPVEEAGSSLDQLRGQVANLRIALERRTVIAQACGMLMEHHNISGDQAFQVLVQISHDEQTKVYDIAETLVTTRRLPAVGGGGASSPDS